MPKRMLKYALPARGECNIEMHAAARVRHVAVQHNRLQLWAEVDADDPANKPRRFLVAYTGSDDIPNSATYVGTAHTSDGGLVFHVYELFPR